MNHRSANIQGHAMRQRLDTYQRTLLALDTGRGLAADGAVLGLLSSVLPWYSATVRGPVFSGYVCRRGVCHAFGFSKSWTISVNGWHSWGYLAILAFLGAAALVLAPVFDVALQSVLAGLPRRATAPRLLLGAGALAVLATLLFVLTAASDLGDGHIVTGGATIGAWGAVPCGVLIAAGGYLSATPSGVSVP